MVKRRAGSMGAGATCLELLCSNSLTHKCNITSSSLNNSNSSMNSANNCYSISSSARGQAPITQWRGQVSSNLSFLRFPCSNSLIMENHLHQITTCHYSTYSTEDLHNDNIISSNYSRKMCVATGRLYGIFSSRPCTSFIASSSSNLYTKDSDPESDSDSDSDSESKQATQQELSQKPLPVPSRRLEESWLLTLDGEDVPTVVSNLPITERYAPRRLLEFVTKKLDSQKFSLAELRSTIMFWQKKKIQEDLSFGSSAFEEKRGVSQLHQWTATELTLQHAQLSRVARDVLYLIYACSLLGLVRVLEAVVATFSFSPPRYAKLLDAMNSLDFFTVAFLAHSLRKPIIGILRVDPIDLDEVVQLKAKIWDEMHKFYERQWKVVATLGMGRLLALVAQTLPSTNAMTKSVKMFWDMLLALPIF